MIADLFIFAVAAHDGLAHRQKTYEGQRRGWLDDSPLPWEQDERGDVLERAPDVFRTHRWQDEAGGA